MLAETGMHAVSECDLFVRNAVESKPIRLVENVFIAIAGKITQHEPIAFRDFLAAQRAIGGCRPHEMLHRRCPSYGLFDERRNQRGIVFNARELIG